MPSRRKIPGTACIVSQWLLLIELTVLSLALHPGIKPTWPRETQEGRRRRRRRWFARTFAYIFTSTFNNKMSDNQCGVLPFLWIIVMCASNSWLDGVAPSNYEVKESKTGNESLRKTLVVLNRQSIRVRAFAWLYLLESCMNFRTADCFFKLCHCWLWDHIGSLLGQEAIKCFVVLLELWFNLIIPMVSDPLPVFYSMYGHLGLPDLHDSDHSSHVHRIAFGWVQSNSLSFSLTTPVILFLFALMLKEQRQAGNDVYAKVQVSEYSQSRT